MTFLNIIVIMICGVLATFTMTLSMGFVHGLGWANADMVRAVGSIYTKKRDNAFWPGALIHHCAGGFFAVFYAIFAGIAPVVSWKGVVLCTSMLGVFHGLAVAVLMSVVVAEHHPLSEFREAGLDVMIAHLAGHVVYGFILGMLFAVGQINLRLL